MFCESYLLLFVKLHKHSSSSMSKAKSTTKNKGKSRSHYRLCVPPCPRYITSGDTHSLCVVCLGVNHVESAIEAADCPHCEWLPLRKLRSQGVLFQGGSLHQHSSRCWPRQPPRLSGGFIRGFRCWIWRREWRRANPYLLPHLPYPLPALWDWKPVLRFPPLRGTSPIFLRGG